MMTRKHYQSIVEDMAELYNRMDTEEERQAVAYAIFTVAQTLRRDNPKFDNVKFHDEFTKLTK